MPKQQSLICAYTLDGLGGGSPLGWDDIKNWEPSQGVLWVHLNYMTKKSATWLEQDSGLDFVTASALTAEESRPRCVPSSKGLLTVLRGVNLNPGQDYTGSFMILSGVLFGALLLILLWFKKQRWL